MKIFFPSPGFWPQRLTFNNTPSAAPEAPVPESEIRAVTEHEDVAEQLRTERNELHTWAGKFDFNTEQQATFMGAINGKVDQLLRQRIEREHANTQERAVIIETVSRQLDDLNTEVMKDIFQRFLAELNITEVAALAGNLNLNDAQKSTLIENIQRTGEYFINQAMEQNIQNFNQLHDLLNQQRNAQGRRIFDQIGQEWAGIYEAVRTAGRSGFESLNRDQRSAILSNILRNPSDLTSIPSDYMEGGASIYRQRIINIIRGEGIRGLTDFYQRMRAKENRGDTFTAQERDAYNEIRGRIDRVQTAASPAGRHAVAGKVLAALGFVTCTATLVFNVVAGWKDQEWMQNPLVAAGAVGMGLSGYVIDKGGPRAALEYFRQSTAQRAFSEVQRIEGLQQWLKNHQDEPGLYESIHANRNTKQALHDLIRRKLKHQERSLTRAELAGIASFRANQFTGVDDTGNNPQQRFELFRILLKHDIGERTRGSQGRRVNSMEEFRGLMGVRQTVVENLDATEESQRTRRVEQRGERFVAREEMRRVLSSTLTFEAFKLLTIGTNTNLLEALSNNAEYALEALRELSVDTRVSNEVKVKIANRLYPVSNAEGHRIALNIVNTGVENVNKRVENILVIANGSSDEGVLMEAMRMVLLAVPTPTDRVQYIQRFQNVAFSTRTLESLASEHPAEYNNLVLTQAEVSVIDGFNPNLRMGRLYRTLEYYDVPLIRDINIVGARRDNDALILNVRDNLTSAVEERTIRLSDHSSSVPANRIDRNNLYINSVAVRTGYTVSAAARMERQRELIQRPSSELEEMKRDLASIPENRHSSRHTRLEQIAVLNNAIACQRILSGLPQPTKVNITQHEVSIRFGTNGTSLHIRPDSTQPEGLPEALCTSINETMLRFRSTLDLQHRMIVSRYGLKVIPHGQTRPVFVDSEEALTLLGEFDLSVSKQTAITNSPNALSPLLSNIRNRSEAQVQTDINAVLNNFRDVATTDPKRNDLQTFNMHPYSALIESTQETIQTQKHIIDTPVSTTNPQTMIDNARKDIGKLKAVIAQIMNTFVQRYSAVARALVNHKHAALIGSSPNYANWNSHNEQGIRLFGRRFEGARNFVNQTIGYFETGAGQMEAPSGFVFGNKEAIRTFLTDLESDFNNEVNTHTQATPPATLAAIPTVTIT